MQPESHYLTREGYEKMRQELEHLKGPGRLEMSKRLRSAIQMGDLSENADYHKAKEDQGFMEGRIHELETILHDAVIIDEMERKSDVVDVGSTVTVREGDYPEEVYYVVGPKEADPAHGRISHESPIGRALMGRQNGDVVQVDTPGGKLDLKILKIE